MKDKLLVLLFVFFIKQSISQENYCDFEGNNVVYFGAEHTGMLDTLFANPAPDTINSSATCAKYIRGTISYDYIKIFPTARLIDVALYADSTSVTPKITMNVFSTAPIGTAVILQLGSSMNNNYPSGIHSEYITLTKDQNVWELDTFNFFQKPLGSTVAADSIDKIVLLFNPASNNSITLYFDNLKGPPLLTIFGIDMQDDLNTFNLYQNIPNPSGEKTSIYFQLKKNGKVSLKIYDLVGNPIYIIPDRNMNAGIYSIPVLTEYISSGIYFYCLNVNEFSQTRKMMISK